MNERSRNIAVGLTALVALIGLAVMMLLFGYAPEWVRPTYPVHVHMPHADRLAQNSAVRLHGINIGHVERVRLAEVPETGVHVLIKVRKNIRVPANVQAVAVTPLLGGSTELDLEPVPVADPEEVGHLATDGTARISGRRGGLVRDLTDEFEAVLEQPLRNFERLADQIEHISAEWTRVGENVNHLIEPRDPEAIDRGEAVANLHSLVQRTEQRMAQMEQVLEGVQRYTDDEQLHEDVRKAVAGARELSDALPGQVEELTRNVDHSVTALRGRYIALADDLSGVLTAMQNAVDRIERGEGTLGKLTTDPSLYDNLDDTVQRMQKAIDDMRLLIEKWKAEGVPVQF